MFRLTRSSLIMFASLLIGILGLVVQWFADTAKFSKAEPPFGQVLPPGILFIAGFGLLSLLTSRWWWHAIFGVLIAFWIVVGGTLAGQMTPNFTSSNAGTVAGTSIMTVGLIAAFVTGVNSMITARRSQRTTAGMPGRVAEQ
jgi:vacuolar-type H+-ATPase subunit I/STV1